MCTHFRTLMCKNSSIVGRGLSLYDITAKSSSLNCNFDIANREWSEHKDKDKNKEL